MSSEVIFWKENKLMTKTDQREDTKTLYAILSYLRDLDPDMPMNQVVCFTWIALNEGRTQVEMRQDLQMASSTSSRSLAALSNVHRLGKPGLGIVEWVENPEDRRAKLLYISDKGKAVLNKLTGMVG